MSVIVPFYNRVDLVVEAIKSVLSQSYQNIEVVLVDDGSTDDVCLVSTMAASDQRLRYVRQANSGPGKARNVGVRLATGDYIAFLDSDDRFLPSKLEQQVRHLEENNLDLSHTSYIRSDVQGRLLSVVHSGRLPNLQARELITECPIAMPTVLGRADVFRYTPFPEGVSLGEDVCLWIKLAATYSFGSLDIPLSVVSVGPGSAAASLQKQAEGSQNVVDFLLGDPVLAVYRPEIAQLQRYGAFMRVCSKLSGSPVVTNRSFMNRISPILRAYGVLQAYGVKGVLRRVRRRLQL